MSWASSPMMMMGNAVQTVSDDFTGGSGDDGGDGVWSTDGYTMAGGVTVATVVGAGVTCSVETSHKT